jgi:hypothetical protein
LSNTAETVKCVIFVNLIYKWRGDCGTHSCDDLNDGVAVCLMKLMLILIVATVTQQNILIITPIWALDRPKCVSSAMRKSPPNCAPYSDSLVTA